MRVQSTSDKSPKNLDPLYQGASVSESKSKMKAICCIAKLLQPGRNFCQKSLTHIHSEQAIFKAKKPCFGNEILHNSLSFDGTYQSNAGLDQSPKNISSRQKYIAKSVFFQKDQKGVQKVVISVRNKNPWSRDKSNNDIMQ